MLNRIVCSCCCCCVLLLLLLVAFDSVVAVVPFVCGVSCGYLHGCSGDEESGVRGWPVCVRDQKKEGDLCFALQKLLLQEQMNEGFLSQEIRNACTSIHTKHTHALTSPWVRLGSLQGCCNRPQGITPHHISCTTHTQHTNTHRSFGFVLGLCKGAVTGRSANGCSCFGFTPVALPFA